MPTGYTASIKDGISFDDFIMQCARGMGACITLRDEPMSTPIPDKFEPSDYHTEKLKEARIELKKYRTYTIKQAKGASIAEYNKAVADAEKRIEEGQDLKNKYLKMMGKVKAWQPPTKEHEGLKKFMIEQIEMSIKFDCSDCHISTSPKLLTATEWINKKINRALYNINYHTKEEAKERERAESRTLWIQQLRKSLNNS